MSFIGEHAPVWEQRLALQESLLELERRMSIGSLALSDLLHEMIAQANELREEDPEYETNLALYHAIVRERFRNVAG